MCYNVFLPIFTYLSPSLYYISPSPFPIISLANYYPLVCSPTPYLNNDSFLPSLFVQVLQKMYLHLKIWS